MGTDFPAGVTSRGIPAEGGSKDLVVGGDVFWVDSGHTFADDGNSGKNKKKPLATIAQGISNATDSNGDLVLVAEGHSETISTGIVVDVIGLKIIGLGRGTLRPYLTGAVADDTVDITAASVEIHNLGFNEATTVTGGAINVAAAYALINNCHFDLGANDLEAITVAAAGTDLEICGNTFNVTANGPDAGIEIESTSARTNIHDNVFQGSDATNPWDAAAINAGAQATTELRVHNNTFSGVGVVVTSVIATGAVDKSIWDNVYASDAVDADDPSGGEELDIEGLKVAGALGSGRIWYVDSADGNASFDGLAPTRALVTLTAAEAAAAAGDTIILMENHAETLTAEVACNLEGMKIIGLGDGLYRPQFLVNYAGNGISLDADGQTLQNVHFNEATNAGATANIDVVGLNCTIRGCSMDLGANDEFPITVTSTASDLLIEGNHFLCTANGVASGVEIEGTTARTTIRNNTFIGDGTNAWDDAAVNATANACTQLKVYDNVFSGGGIAMNSVVATGAVDKAVFNNVYMADAIDADDPAGGVQLATVQAKHELVGQGRAWYVDSNNGAATFDGMAPNRALTTINAAIDLAAAGDTIYAMEGHAENLANATTIIPDVNSIKIIGLGTGARRPTLTFTHANGNIPISGTDVLFKNFLLTNSGTIDVTIGITLSGNESIIEDVEMREATTTDQFACGIHAAASVYGVIRRFKFLGLAGDATVTAIRISGSNNIEIVDCDIVGNFTGNEDAVGCIQSLTTNNTDIRIHHNVMENRDGTSEAGIVCVATDTGFLYENFIAVPTGDFGQGIIADTAMRQYNNYVVDVATERGLPEGTGSA